MEFSKVEAALEPGADVDEGMVAKDGEEVGLKADKGQGDRIGITVNGAKRESDTIEDDEIRLDESLSGN